jgi:hypothetical protein
MSACFVFHNSRRKQHHAARNYLHPDPPETDAFSLLSLLLRKLSAKRMHHDRFFTDSDLPQSIDKGWVELRDPGWQARKMPRAGPCLWRVFMSMSRVMSMSGPGAFTPQARARSGRAINRRARSHRRSDEREGCTENDNGFEKSVNARSLHIEKWGEPYAYLCGRNLSFGA